MRAVLAWAKSRRELAAVLTHRRGHASHFAQEAPECDGGVKTSSHPLWETRNSSKAPLKDVEMVPTFQIADELDETLSSQASSSMNLGFASHEQQEAAGVLRDEPLQEGLTNTCGGTPYRVSWFSFRHVSPSKAFVYWSFRRLRDLPPEWREYYRRMLRQEVKAARYVNQTWDVFMMVVDGYRKGKWILAKYGVTADESLIPKPYNNFWEETTHEERVWAHRRSSQMKDLQALQRDEESLVFGAQTADRRDVHFNSLKNLQGGMQGGSPVHANDLPAPREEDIVMDRAAEEMSSALMSSIEDDKLWNPVLKARLHKQKMRDEAEFYTFEDDEDESEGDDSPSILRNEKTKSRPNIMPVGVQRLPESEM